MSGGEVTVNGVRLAFEQHGRGAQTAVLVGPIGAPGRAWLPFQVPALVEAGFRVLTFDPRGVPPSDVPDPPYSVEEMTVDAAGLIEHLSDDPAVVIGYSMGALITQELALSRPDLCRGAALLGTLGRKDVFRRALFEASLAALRTDAESAQQMQTVTRALQLFGPDRLDDDRWAQRYLDMALDASSPNADARRGLLGQQAATTAYDDRLDALRGIVVPTLVVGFELDLLVPAKLTREVAAAISGSHYIEIPRCGHGGPWELPTEVNAVLLEFLDRFSNRP